MKNWWSGISKRMYLAVALMLGVLLVGGLTGSDNIGIEFGDYDGDRMPDDYENFYGLNSTNPADAAFDYDGDMLSNLDESSPTKLTDPFSYDTDFDGWNDKYDAVISRAWLPFGVEQFTHGDIVSYAHPDWISGGAWKWGGEWTTNPPAWRVAGSESNMAGLLIAVDRSILTNNLIFALHYEGRVPPSNSVEQSASLLVDLLTTNTEVIAADLYGNLLGGSNAEQVVYLAVPTAQFPEAAIIRLRVERAPDVSASGGSEVRIFEGLVYIDEDFDGLDAETERSSPFHTSDFAVDSDGDRTSDYDQYFNQYPGGGSSTNDPGGGGLPPPGGGGDDGDQGGGNNQGIIFIDQAIGDDNLTGRAPEVRGSDGPKKTISQGLAAADRDGAHTLVIKSGAYGEDLDLRGKNLKVVIEGKVKL